MSIRASVIVPVFNAEGTIEECLRCVANQTVPGSEYEIIVVDDGSTDSTASLIENFANGVRDPAIHLVRRQQSGPAAARNQGANHARGDIILFTDSDCFVERDWLERMLTPFSDSGVVGAKGVYRTDQREWIARFVQLEYDSKYRRMAKFPSIDFVDTYSAAFRKDVFLAAGGYDTAFQRPSVEDQEFSFRLAARGHRMVFVADAVVRHLHVNSLGGYFRKKFKIGYYKAKLLSRHPHRLAGDSHTPKSLQAQVALFLLFPPVFILAALRWIPWWVLAGVGVGYVFTMLPFVAGSFRRDLAVALLAPLMVICRSMALGIGLVVGCVRFGPPRARNDRP